MLRGGLPLISEEISQLLTAVQSRAKEGYNAFYVVQEKRSFLYCPKSQNNVLGTFVYRTKSQE